MVTDPSQHRPYSQPHRLVRGSAGQRPQIPQQCQKLLQPRYAPRSDALCRQYGLSVIETERSQQSSQPYAEWQAGQTGQPTWRSLIRQDVDDAINRSLTWRQFVQAMELKGTQCGSTANTRFCSRQTKPDRCGSKPWASDTLRRLSATESCIRDGGIQRVNESRSSGLAACTGTYRKARKLTGLRACIIDTCTNWARCPASRSAPRYGRAAGHSQFGQAHPADGIFVSPRNQYSGAVGYLPARHRNRQ